MRVFFFLAVQDERGPRKSKTPKITETNTVISKNWKTRSNIQYNLIIIIFFFVLTFFHLRYSSRRTHFRNRCTDIFNKPEAVSIQWPYDPFTESRSKRDTQQNVAPSFRFDGGILADESHYTFVRVRWIIYLFSFMGETRCTISTSLSIAENEA